MELAKIKGGFIYFDANIFIYAIEGAKDYSDKIRKLFSKIAQTNSIIITSELTLVECLGKPYNELADSIHLATAINHGCNVFVTNDIKLKIPDNIERLLFKNVE